MAYSDTRQKWDPLRSPRHASWWTVGAFLIVTALYVVPANLSFFASPRLYRLTGGLIQQTLLNSLVGLVLVSVLLFGLARLTLRDVGLDSNLFVGLGFTLLLWGVVQAAVMVVQIVIGGELQLNPTWRDAGVVPVLGVLLAQLVGNALLEEVGWRGFMLPQLFHKLAFMRPRLRVGVALLLSQVLFALMHVPNQVWIRQAGLMDLALFLPSLVTAGLLFSWTYLRSRNLFVVVGFHSLVNEPTLVYGGFSGDLAQGAVVALVGMLLLAFWFRTKNPRQNPSM